MYGDQVRLGLHSGQQYHSVDECIGLWTRAEQLGFDWISLFDHQRPPIGGARGPCFDGPTLLAALAGATQRIRCGLLVSPVTWRHPAQTAAVAATLDHVMHGRLEFGVGAGSADLAYAMYGLPYPPPRERLRMLDETCHILRALWTQPATTFRGQHYQLEEATLEPKPLQRRLPLVIGGEGNLLIEIAGEHADIWNTLAPDLDVYAAKSRALDVAAGAAGREGADVRRSITFRAVLAPTVAAAQERAERLFTSMPSDSPDKSEFLVVGTPDMCTAVLEGYMALGVRDFILASRPPLDWPTIESVALGVAPQLRGPLPPTAP